MFNRCNVHNYLITILIIYAIALIIPNNSYGMDVYMTSTVKKIEKLIDEFIHNDDIASLETAVDKIEAFDESMGFQNNEAGTFRKEKLILMLDVFNAIDSKIIPGFDLDKVPDITVAPPPETGLPAGVSPDSVVNPVLKKKYEEDIHKNQARLQTYNFQLKLNKMDELCLGDFKEHISVFYTRNVNDLLEIEVLIDEKITAAERKNVLKDILMNP